MPPSNSQYLNFFQAMAAKDPVEYKKKLLEHKPELQSQQEDVDRILSMAGSCSPTRQDKWLREMRDLALKDGITYGPDHKPVRHATEMP
mmetsp:Transcript_25001/g.61856  ORF Transcript_25001/g.61856 Transcript_25001/m.61856 type:complete len:89 (-) Transcript_25001:845-1111(-)